MYTSKDNNLTPHTHTHTHTHTQSMLNVLRSNHQIILNSNEDECIADELIKLLKSRSQDMQ